MSPVDKGRGDVARAAAGVREVGDIAQRHGVRLAVEFNSQCDQINTLERVREIMPAAARLSGQVARAAQAGVRTVPAANR